MKIFVKPGGADRRVPIPGPGTPIVPAAGMEVELTPYVQRRLDCGDLVREAPGAAPAPAKKE